MRFLLKAAGEGKDLGGQPAAAGLQDTSLGVGKAGEIGAGQRVQVALDGPETGGPVGGGGAERRSALVGHAGLRGTGIAQQRLAGNGVRGAATGDEESFRLPRGEGVAADGVGEARLLGAREGGDRERCREDEAAGVEAYSQLGGQAASQRQAALDPGFFAAQQLGDGGGSESLFLYDGDHDAGLVHGAEGLGGGVGGQQPRFGRGARDGLDDDGDLPEPLAGPMGQALEAVENLEGTVGGGGDPERQRREIGLAVGPRPPQRRPGGPEAVGRNGKDEIHRGASSKGRIW